MTQSPAPITEGAELKEPIRSKKDWLPIVAWGVACLMVLLMVMTVLQVFGVIPTAAATPEPVNTQNSHSTIPLPEFRPVTIDNALKKLANPITDIPDRGNEIATTYTVGQGDSVFSIATKYKLEPESVLWANQATLQDDPQMISIGLTLNIPPVDGVYYQWKEGDTLDAVAGKYGVTAEDILNWPGNRFDMTDPQVSPGQFVMIPGGKGEFRQWVVPIAYQPRSGASRAINNQCAIPDGFYAGTGTFIWPSGTTSISGNDFWSGHLGIDIAAYLGDNVMASDSGIVVYAGGMGGGYGIVVIIEHDTTYYTYHTVYAHLSNYFVTCGQRVVQGQSIGAAGSTGNSTGPHIHFEIRQNGDFINPHYVLP